MISGGFQISKADHLKVCEKNAVRLEIGGKVFWKGLPEGYQYLDYIEVDGDQYINTRFVPNQDTRVVCEFMYFGGTGIYGSRSTVSSRNFSLRVINDAWQFGYGNGVTTGTIASDTTDWHIADQDKNKLYIDGELSAERDYVAFTSPYPIAIGAIKAGSMYYGKGRYRSFKIYDNGVLVRDFIPCIHPTGYVGMYDTVHGLFYGDEKFGDVGAVDRDGFMIMTDPVEYPTAWPIR